MNPKSKTTRQFRKQLEQLPRQTQVLANKQYQLFKENPRHASLNFKKVHSKLEIYSARVGRGHRVLCRVNQESVLWFWIGTHANYDKLLSQL